jgi:hypothetical protein
MIDAIIEAYKAWVHKEHPDAATQNEVLNLGSLEFFPRCAAMRTMAFL